jgi:hypothetical protein
MKMVHTHPENHPLDRVYAQLTQEEVDEINKLCERLQQIFLAQGYTWSQELSIDNRSDVTVTIHGALQNGTLLSVGGHPVN